MHVTIETKTNERHTRVVRTRRDRQDRNPAKMPPPPVWRPEPSRLTRAELRRIVIDTLG